MKVKNLNENYKLMNELINEQLELFDINNFIPEENKKLFYKIDKRSDNLDNILSEQYKNLNIAMNKENGKLYKVKNAKYLLNAVLVENAPMSKEKFFSEYIAL